MSKQLDPKLEAELRASKQTAIHIDFTDVVTEPFEGLRAKKLRRLLDEFASELTKAMREGVDPDFVADSRDLSDVGPDTSYIFKLRICLDRTTDKILSSK